MAWISARTLILHRIVWQVTLSYFLWKNPEQLYKNFFVFAVGAKLPPIWNFDEQLRGFAAALLLLSALQDLVLLIQEQWLAIFRGIVPVRLVVLFVLGFLSYSEWAPTLAVGPIFAYLFFDTLFNFWIFTTVREEQNELTRQKILLQRDGQ